jgi:hypothetical protein
MQDDLEYTGVDKQTYTLRDQAKHALRRVKGLLVAVLEPEGDKHWQVLESLQVLRNSYLPLSTLNADADFQRLFC